MAAIDKAITQINTGIEFAADAAEISKQLNEAFGRMVSGSSYARSSGSGPLPTYMQAHPNWPYGTVIQRDETAVTGFGRVSLTLKAMWIGGNWATPLSGYAHTDHVPIEINPKHWTRLEMDD